MTLEISPFAMDLLNKTLDACYESTNSLIDISTPELRKIAAEARNMLESVMLDSYLRNSSYTTLVEMATTIFGEDFTEKFNEEK